MDQRRGGIGPEAFSAQLPFRIPVGGYRNHPTDHTSADPVPNRDNSQDLREFRIPRHWQRYAGFAWSRNGETAKRVNQSTFCTRSFANAGFSESQLPSNVTAFLAGYLIRRLINTMERVCGRRGFGRLHVTLRAYHPLFSPLFARRGPSILFPGLN